MDTDAKSPPRAGTVIRRLACAAFGLALPFAVTAGALAAPTASFTYSPASPKPGEQVALLALAPAGSPSPASP